jgi:acyl-CoA thioester hydrolase
MADLHRFSLRVYWEDTDAGGIVYHSNYLNFAERARTEALLATGLRQTDLRDTLGVVFAVREARISFRAPARLEDQLVVTTAVEELRGARLMLAQKVWRDDDLLAEVHVTLACIDRDGRPTRVPAAVAQAFGAG